MKVPILVVGAALLTTTCGEHGQNPPTAALPAQPRRPNIVMVLVDDMRWDEMRIAGHPFIDTPNMDRLAREGARFTNAFACTPLCSPSRATFLTGQYPHINGIIDNTARPSHHLQVFPLELQRAGYRTGFFGKWHMGNDDSPRPGFDHWVAMPGQGEAIDPSLNVDGERVHAKGYTTDLLTDYVERFMDGASDNPFLVYLAHTSGKAFFAMAWRSLAVSAAARARPPFVSRGALCTMCNRTSESEAQMLDSVRAWINARACRTVCPNPSDAEERQPARAAHRREPSWLRRWGREASDGVCIASKMGFREFCCTWKGAAFDPRSRVLANFCVCWRF